MAIGKDDATLMVLRRLKFFLRDPLHSALRKSKLKCGASIVSWTVSLEKVIY